MVLALTDLKKVSHAVDNEVVTKDVYDEMVKKVNAFDTRGLVKKTDYDAKINEINGEILSITGLAATSLNAVKNEIRNISDLVKKTDYDAETSDIESKCFAISDYNKYTNNILDVKVKN